MCTVYGSDARPASKNDDADAIRRRAHRCDFAGCDKVSFFAQIRGVCYKLRFVLKCQRILIYLVNNSCGQSYKASASGNYDV